MEPPANTAKYFFWLLNVLLGIAFIAGLLASGPSSRMDAATIVLAASASIIALQRELPLQNVLPVALMAALIGGLAHGLSASLNFSMPFGPLVFNSACGVKIFNAVPWTIPLLWIVVIFNARGVARLILRPWRGVKNYGVWFIGLTCLLAVAFDFALEPFAWHVKHFWLWQHDKNSGHVGRHDAAEFPRLGVRVTAHHGGYHTVHNFQAAGRSRQAGFSSAVFMAWRAVAVRGRLRKSGPLAGSRRGRGHCCRHDDFCGSRREIISCVRGGGVVKFL